MIGHLTKMVMFRIGLVVVFLCVNAEAQTHCAGNWVSHGNSCYAFITTIKSSWIDAGAFCRNANAKLVEIESADEDNFLRAHLLASHTSENFWIGGTDAMKEGNWVWMSTQDPLDYNGWNPGEPNNGVGAACMAMANHEHYHWNDDFCTKSYDFICEKEHESIILGRSNSKLTNK
eukprot:XP_011425311.1 PREDICTED: perlucin [Crassostrea gigas]